MVKRYRKLTLQHLVLIKQKNSKQAVLAKRWWAEPDSNRRPLARKANVLTRLDDRPTQMTDKKTT